MMPTIQDGPRSAYFFPLNLKGNSTIPALEKVAISPEMSAALKHAPSGSCTSWGIPFEIDSVVVIAGQPVRVDFNPIQTRWLVFCHTSDVRPDEFNSSGFISPMRGNGKLTEKAADYVILYADGSEVRAPILRRHQIGPFQRIWSENCFQAVAHHKPQPVPPPHEQLRADWGKSQTRTDPADDSAWVNWLWAWENPHPEKTIRALRFEPANGIVILSAISAGDVASMPLRWQARQKACMTLPPGVPFDPELNQEGLLEQIQLDLGQVISAVQRPIYPLETWPQTYNNQRPAWTENQVLIEFTAHLDACFHVIGGQTLALAQLTDAGTDGPVSLVTPATQTVTLRVIERDSGQRVAVKLHVHGASGEYLAPVDRHRILNPSWFEDYSADFAHILIDKPTLFHSCTYINGETLIKLPLGKVYIEVSKGFEIQPVRQIVDVSPETEEITIAIEKLLPWREKGWVTADTHVHFLSPTTAMLEGAAEGVNIVNLLASQWGELMTNVGDFDGQTTHGSKESGGDGEYLVRVGTENRQHVLGHISLLGYNGGMIAPMTTGGPDESALGDPVEILLTEWARQCRKQGGLVVLPHFPNPRAEHAASIVSGDIDAVEMTCWEHLYRGISPYSLSDWYRYLNCGYLVAAVAGTDKMSANTAVGTVRTYAHIHPESAFTYEAWKDAIRRAETFVTYGPLLEFMVDGYPMGSRIQLPSQGGTLDVVWQAASVTIPMSRIELVVNGEIRESLAVSPNQASGQWSIKVDRSAWLALLVRGHYDDQPEIIAAHSSPVLALVEGSPILAAADAVTILDQIEGAMAYIDTVGTRAEDRVYKRMRLVLESAHRTLHNRMHQNGAFHEHLPRMGA